MDPEVEEMKARLAADMAEEASSKLKVAADVITRFTEIALTKGVVLEANSFEYIRAIGIVARSPGIARKLLGAIHVENDGLLPYAELARMLPPHRFQGGYFQSSDYMLMAHPCFRREMHENANWAPHFVDLFWNFDCPDLSKYIAIDENRVRIDVAGRSYMESDTWYGAPYNDDVRLIQPGIVKLCPSPGLSSAHIDFFFAKAHCLDIKWSESHGIKTFQALELKTDDVRIEIDEQEYFPARYLHAEFDVANNCFRHFDGAIQYFLENEYFQRRESDFNMPAKNPAHIKARSTKVFKINGPLKTEHWADLCCHFFTGNPLTFEYFTGQYPEHISNILEKIRHINS